MNYSTHEAHTIISYVKQRVSLRYYLTHLKGKEPMTYNLDHLANELKKLEGTRDPYLLGRRDALRELVSSGGVGIESVGTQVLYMLPDTFIRFYEQLFTTALRVDGGAVSGRGGIGKAKGASGTVLGSEVGAQAKGGGKKWKEPKQVIGSETALKLKGHIDRELTRMAFDGTQELTRGRRGEGSGKSKRCSGKISKYDGTNGECGMFLSPKWKFCPRCGNVVEGRG